MAKKIEIPENEDALTTAYLQANCCREADCDTYGSRYSCAAHLFQGNIGTAPNAVRHQTELMLQESTHETKRGWSSTFKFSGTPKYPLLIKFCRAKCANVDVARDQGGIRAPEYSVQFA